MLGGFDFQFSLMEEVSAFVSGAGGDGIKDKFNNIIWNHK